MKILIMGNNDHVGGLIVHFLVLCDHIKESGHELFIININDHGKKQFNLDSIPEVNVPYKTISFIQKIKKYFILRNASKKVKKFDPDLFIATGYGHGYIMISKSLSSHTFKLFEEVHYEPHEIALKQHMVKHYDAVATQTYGMIDVFKQNISTQKPVAYLPCFSKPYVSQQVKPIPQSPSLKLVFFGRLERNKGIRNFVEVTKDLLKKGKVKLDIYGKGSEQNGIENSIEKNNLGDYIALKGFYDDKDFPDIISSYHGVVIPSLDTEGLPLVVIESMRFGRPIFCTDVGAMPEIASVNTHGMVVSKKSPEDLKENLQIFLEKLKNNNFSAEKIFETYQNGFSNHAFWEIWQKMISNPSVYFNKV